MNATVSHLVVIGTGGTIAGRSPEAGDPLAYAAGSVALADLLQAALPPTAVPPGWVLQAEPLADIDSKDMGFALWRDLALGVARHLARPEVGGIVVTHGTDTMEETAYFLQRVLAPTKPVVLTGAMRPAGALLSDGPQNLLDALAVATHSGVSGTLVVMGQRVWSAREVRKAHTLALDAFEGGEAGPLAMLGPAGLQVWRAWPTADHPPDAAAVEALLGRDPASWPWVEVLMSAAGTDGRAVNALVTAGVQGLVVAGTGNGTVHAALEAALQRASAQGVVVARASRCANGPVVPPAEDATRGWLGFGGLTPAQARIELLLRLARAVVDTTPPVR